jgi:hypothetical protein
MKTIRIDVGLNTAVKFKLQEKHFEGAKTVIFAIKNYLNEDEYVVKREFSSPGEYVVVITPEESLKLKNCAKYGFGIRLYNEKDFRLTLNGGIELSRGVYSGD